MPQPLNAAATLVGMDTKLLTKIGNLLRQAENTDNPHEAETFMQAAQRLATARSIDLAAAAAAAADHHKAPVPIVRQITLGESGKRGLRTYVELFQSVAFANDLQLDVAHNSTFVVAYGFPSDIDVVEALYSGLVVQMVAACDAFLKDGTWRDQTSQRVVTHRDMFGVRQKFLEDRPTSKITARISFQTAYAQRIGQRLSEARDAAVADARHSDVASGTSTELVLTGKELAIKDFYAEHSQARGSWRNGGRNAFGSSHASSAGDRAARDADLGQSSAALPASRRAVEA